MEYYMDEKSRMSGEDSSTLSRSVSHRSFPHKSSSSLTRSSSHKLPSSKSSHSSSHKYSEFTRKAKEQKSKLYIVKRCITMLVSWKKHEDS